MTPADLPAVHVLNQANTPHVGSVDEARLGMLLDESITSLVVMDEDELAAYVIAFGPGADYDSVNYRWFADRYADFLYVDRVAVAADHRRRGYARLLYAQLEADTDAPWFTCEVNVRPPNEASMRFHTRLGFVEVGQQDTDGGAKRVALLAKDLRGSAARLV